MMRAEKLAGRATILFLALSLGLALVGFSPRMGQAVTNPIVLQLGGEGATSWSISHIKPGDGGTKLVELRNAGSKDGFVTIWVSDIVNTQTFIPPPETGKYGEPGRMPNFLLLNLSTENLTSSMNLPTTIGRLPQNASGPDYIEVTPLKAGEAFNLWWQWELPARAGNGVQGDRLSFSINYLLREMNITDVAPVVTTEGIFTANVTAVSEQSKGEIDIRQGTTGKTKDNKPLSEIWIVELDQKPSAPPQNTSIIGQTYAAGPDGSTFDRPVTITLSYDPRDLPQRAHEEDMVIALWDKDTGKWVELAGSTVDRANHTISVLISHFSRYTVLAHLPPPPPSLPPQPAPSPPPSQPAPPQPPEETPLPPVVGPDDVAPRLLETNILGEIATTAIEADGTLKEALRLTDSSGNFIIDFNSGTRVTGADGQGLGRLELTITQEAVTLPDNMVGLSPLYKVTGYTRGLEVTPVTFEPPARLTIGYDPKSLPENSFSPFIATFTAERRLVRLEPPPGSTVEIGKAKALIGQGLLFAVIAEQAPPPPPLPAKFAVSDLTINPQQARAGQPVIIGLTIANGGAITGSYELYLVIDGIVRATKTITLTGNSIETISFEVSNLAAGRHQVKLAGLIGEFQILDTVTTLPVAPPIDWLFVDLSIAAAIVAGLLTLYLVVRRSQQRQSI